MQTSKFNNNGLNIYFDKVGTHRDYFIICLHGLASNATRWHEFFNHSTLQKQGQMLALDLRGHGRSMTHRAYTRADWCDDLDSIVHNISEPCILIGHSMGAQIALDYATRHSNKLSGMVLIDPVFPQALTGTLRKVASTRLLLRLLVGLLRLCKLTGLYKRKYPARDLQVLDKQTREFLNNNPDKNIANLYMNPFTDLEFMPLTNYLQDLIEVTRPLPSLETVDVPTLVLLSQGASTSDVELNKNILSNISDCKIQSISADHWLLTERPIEARDSIDAWCMQHLKIK